MAENQIQKVKGKIPCISAKLHEIYFWSTVFLSRQYLSTHIQYSLLIYYSTGMTFYINVNLKLEGCDYLAKQILNNVSPLKRES